LKSKKNEGFFLLLRLYVTLSANFPLIRWHSSLEYEGKIWMIGGTDGNNIYNDVWSSTDGISWTLVTSP
jgi:hypothetical protein